MARLRSSDSCTTRAEVDQPASDTDTRRASLPVEARQASERAVRSDGIGDQGTRGLVHAGGAGPTARGHLSPRAPVVPLLLPHDAARAADGGGVRDSAPSVPARASAARGGSGGATRDEDERRKARPAEKRRSV